MINWFNMPVEGLSNGGQFEIKELTATENRTYEKDGEVYNKVTVNVEGGGGSSDFSTAEVTLTTGSSAEEYLILIPIIDIDSNLCQAVYQFSGQGENELIVPLYKGTALAVVDGQYTVSVTGDAEFDEEEYIVAITGNCTITLS